MKFSVVILMLVCASAATAQTVNTSPAFIDGQERDVSPHRIPVAPAPKIRPTECQSKAAYLQFLIASRRQNIPETSLVDYDHALDSDWKAQARKTVYHDPSFIVTDMGQTIWAFYSKCSAESNARQPAGK